MDIEFKPENKSVIAQNLPSGLVFAAIVCAYLYFMRGETNVLLYILFSAIAIAASFAFFMIRSSVGRVDGIRVKEASVDIEKKNDLISLAWADITRIEFETVDNVPWLAIEADSKETKCCLQSFSEKDKQALIDAFKSSYQGEVTIKTTWVTQTTD